MKKRSRVLFLTLFLSNIAGATTHWQEIQTIRQACTCWPKEIGNIFNNMDLDNPRLSSVKTAYRNGDLPDACEKLLQYYANSKNARLLKTELPPVSEKTTPEAEAILEDTYTFQQVTGHTPRSADGHLTWTFRGQNNDIEWAWALNRHYPVRDLMSAYYETGNPKYIRYADTFIKDWIIQSRPYPAKKSSTEMWRGLEVAAREKYWAQIFYEFLETDFISPATRLLVLSSVSNHAHYNRHFHMRGGNWVTMEMTGLATVATAWPEFKQSEEWLEYSIDAMTKSLKEQVYPDGVQKELTSHYHRVALSNFSLLYDICRKAQKPLPKEFTTTLEQMWDYLAQTMRPSGYGLLNNDSDLDYNCERILDAASQYNRPDWENVASNGKSGTPLGSEPSFIFPWAGHLISRSGYDADAQWSFFDIGPWGIGHQHNDKLHLSVSAFGRDLLTDSGRFAYSGSIAEKFRKYALGSQSHNTILVDGEQQDDGPPSSKAPLSEKQYEITPDYDYACGSFNRFKNLKGSCTHTRSLHYQRGEFWVVVDQISTDRPRTIQALWHFHPDCALQKEQSRVLTDNPRGNLTLIPVGETDWKVELIKGQKSPEIQGWYSREYNTCEPNTTAAYSTSIQSDCRFIWVLFPSENTHPDIHAKVISSKNNTLKIRVYGKNYKQSVTIPL